MTIIIGSDHAGFDLKQKLKNKFPQFDWLDVGTHSLDSVDYPDFANLVCEKLINLSKVKPSTVEAQKSNTTGASNIPTHFGVLMCGSGQGMAIRANKFKNIRAALCWSQDIARLSREHNDANILCLSSRHIDEETNYKIFETFIHTAFAGGRHEQRVKKLCL